MEGYKTEDYIKTPESVKKIRLELSEYEAHMIEQFIQDARNISSLWFHGYSTRGPEWACVNKLQDTLKNILQRK